MGSRFLVINITKKKWECEKSDIGPRSDYKFQLLHKISRHSDFRSFYGIFLCCLIVEHDSFHLKWTCSHLKPVIITSVFQCEKKKQKSFPIIIANKWNAN